LSSAVTFGLYTARFPFLENDKEKIRPVIVVSKPHGRYNIVTVVPVSASTGKEEVDIELLEWQHAGLIEPSIARVHRLSALLQSELTSQLGMLSEKDQANLLEALQILLGLRNK
jgi:mRNA-degrading endonuclease toxin of MazEF toxin-antitoxin module